MAWGSALVIKIGREKPFNNTCLTSCITQPVTRQDFATTYYPFVKYKGK